MNEGDMGDYVEIGFMFLFFCIAWGVFVFLLRDVISFGSSRDWFFFFGCVMVFISGVMCGVISYMFLFISKESIKDIKGRKLRVKQKVVERLTENAG